jgi:hypothetical protein
VDPDVADVWLISQAVDDGAIANEEVVDHLINLRPCINSCHDLFVIDHIGINCADYPKSQAFYDTVLAVLGFSRQTDRAGTQSGNPYRLSGRRRKRRARDRHAAGP